MLNIDKKIIEKAMSGDIKSHELVVGFIKLHIRLGEPMPIELKEYTFSLLDNLSHYLSKDDKEVKKLLPKNSRKKSNLELSYLVYLFYKHRLENGDTKGEAKANAEEYFRLSESPIEKHIRAGREYEEKFISCYSPPE